MSIFFVNGNGNLGFICGSVVYEIPTKASSQAAMFATKCAEDAYFKQGMEMCAKASVRVGNRLELEEKDSPLIRIWNGPKARAALGVAS